MRTHVIVAIAAVGLALGACSKQDRQEVGEGAAAVGGEVKEAAGEIAHDPDVKEAGAAIGAAGAEAADAVKDTAGEIQEGVADASADARREAEEQRAASGDTSRK
ncbi:MAG TPA: cell surface protein [Caulobacter sp.]|nr:cell surface protein [Caulobacter sp.]